MTNNIVMDSGGSNQHTVYTTKVEELRANQITLITPPTTVQNYSVGPKDTIIVDLLRIEKRFNIDGRIDYTDRTKFKDLFEVGGVFVMVYGGDDYNVVMEKMTITEIPEDEDSPDTLVVKFSTIVGKNFGSS